MITPELSRVTKEEYQTSLPLCSKSYQVFDFSDVEIWQATRLNMVIMMVAINVMMMIIITTIKNSVAIKQE